MYSKIKQKIVSSNKSFVLKGSQGVEKTNLIFDCFLEKIFTGDDEKNFFITSTSSQSFFLKEKTVLDRRLRSGYSSLNIVTLNNFIKKFIRDYLFFSKYKSPALPVEQYSGSRLLFILYLLEKTTLPARYENLKIKNKFVANIAEIFSFLSDLSISPYFLNQIKGYEWIFNIYNIYKTKSMENGFYFNDLLPNLAVDILNSLPNGCHMGNYAFYIDDLQETTPAQYRFLKTFGLLLRNKQLNCRFVITYDPDYCLNSSKGASVSIVKKFIDDFAVEKNNIIELKNNLVLNEPIYKLRENLIDYTDYTDESQKNADLFDRLEPDNSVMCVQTPTYIDQTYYIAAKIKHFIGDGVMPSEIGIFVNKFDKNTALLKTVLKSYSIPVEFDFGDLIENSIIYRFFQFFLDLIENTDCDDTVCLLLDSPVFGLDSRTVGDIKKCAAFYKKSVFDSALRYSDKINDLKKRKIVRDTLFFISNVKLKDQNVSGIFYKFAEISGLFDYSLKNEYTELNVLRKIFKEVDFFMSFYGQLKQKNEPELKDLIDNQEYFIHKTVRNTNLEQLDSVKIVSLRSKVPAKFKVVFVPDMNVNVFPNILYERIPCLLNDIAGKIANLKKPPVVSDKNYLLNAVSSANCNILFLYAQESGEPSPLYDYIRSLPYVFCERLENAFAEFDNPFFIRDSSASEIWALRKLADDIIPEHKEVIKKNISLFMSSIDLKQDTATLDSPLPVSLRDAHIFSATDIDVYLDCPRKFFFKRLMKIEDDTLSENTLFGILIHSVLELFHSLYPDWTKELSPEEISNRQKNLFKLLERQIKIFENFSDFMRVILIFQAKNCLSNYFTALMEEKIKIYYMEKTINFFMDNVPFTAKIDRIDTGALNGGYRIIDYKTGSKPVKSAGLKSQFVFEKLNTTKKSFQLPIYYFAAEKIMGLNAKELSIFFLQAKDNKTKQAYCLKSVLPVEPESKSKQVTVEELNNVKDKIIDYTNEIKNGIYKKNKKKSKCYECPCKFICG